MGISWMTTPISDRHAILTLWLAGNGFEMIGARQTKVSIHATVNTGV